MNKNKILIRVGGFLRSAMAGTAGRDGKVTVTDYSKNVPLFRGLSRVLYAATVAVRFRPTKTDDGLRLQKSQAPLGVASWFFFKLCQKFL